MNYDNFHFQLGAFQGVAVVDSIWESTLGDLYPEIPADRFPELFRKYHITPNEKFDINCLLLISRDHLILLDTGWGDSILPDTGMLLQNLESEGISPGKIDIVIHSHGHPDHIGGNTNSRGERNFPAARHFMHREEWKFWNSNPDLSGAGDKKETIETLVKKNLLAIRDSIQAVDEKEEIVPGVKLIQAHGHTPGHSGCSISSGGEQLLCVGDVFHNPLGVSNPTWRMCLDDSPEQAAATRARIVELASSTQALVFGSHLPFPGLGHIVKWDDFWVWEPLKV